MNKMRLFTYQSETWTVFLWKLKGIQNWNSFFEQDSTSNLNTTARTLTYIHWPSYDHCIHIRSDLPVVEWCWEWCLPHTLHYIFTECNNHHTQSLNNLKWMEKASEKYSQNWNKWNSETDVPHIHKDTHNNEQWAHCLDTSEWYRRCNILCDALNQWLEWRVRTTNIKNNEKKGEKS